MNEDLTAARAIKISKDSASGDEDVVVQEYDKIAQIRQ